MSSALTRLRRITVGARDDADADALGLEMARRSQCWQLGGETVEIVPVKDLARVQSAFYKVQDAFAEVGSLLQDGKCRCEERGLNATFRKETSGLSRHLMMFERDDGVKFQADVRDEKSEKSSSQGVAGHIVSKNQQLYLAHTGGFSIKGMQGIKAKFCEFAGNEGWELISVDGKQMVLITQIAQPSPRFSHK